MKRLASALFFFLVSTSHIFAQGSNASLTGFVQDSSKAFIPGVRVLAVNTDTNQQFDVTTNKDGSYNISSLPVGPYRMQIEKVGFRTILKEGLFLHTQDVLQVNYQMEIGSTSEAVTVGANGNNINTTDGGVGTVIDRQFVEGIPMNGRSFQSLVLLSPGVVTNNPTTSQPGEYSVNGMRTNSNTYTVDGASASNTAYFASNAATAGSLPTESVLGTTQSMLSVDALEEFREATSSYSAEYGGQPGAQVSLRSRSGTNEYHGTLYDYLRNSFFDSNNWFNTYATPAVPTPAERQNDFGGTFGGPISIPHVYSGKDRAFLFFSYEGLRLVNPQPASIFYVPSNGTYNTGTYSNPQYKNLRQYAPAALHQLLNAWPLPNCSTVQDPQCVDYGDGGSPYLQSPGSTGTIDSINVRIDYHLSPSMRIFARHSDTTSNSVTGYKSGPSILGLYGRNQVYLLGADTTFGRSISNELRLQYAPSMFKPVYVPSQAGGAQPIDLYAVQGLPVGGESAVTFDLPTAAVMYQVNYGSLQFQPNATDSLTFQHGKHLFKAGASYRQTTAYYGDGQLSRGPFVSYAFSTAALVLANTPSVSSTTFLRTDPTFKNLGVFLQDEWRLLPRLSLSLGLRWDLDPPPSISGAPMYTYTGDIHNPASLGLSAPDAPLYKTTYTGFAPRIGMAATILDQPSHELVLRIGGGLFNDSISLLDTFGNGTNLGTSAKATYTTDPFPLTLSEINVPVAIPPQAPYNFFYYPDNRMVPPYSLQWNASLEQAFGGKQSVTLGYVGSIGRKLSTLIDYSVGALNKQFGSFYLYENGPGSSYDSLQLKYQRQMSHGLQVLSSYTWSHAIDSISTDTTYTYPVQKGNSDNDVRHNLTAALVYNVPAPAGNILLTSLLGHWNADLWFVARTAFPYEPVGPAVLDPNTGDEIYGQLNYNGQNPYIYKAGIPGGRQINPADFSVTSTPLGAGNAPRNFLRGFGEDQSNISIQRNFPLFERAQLLFRVEAFNIANHPTFGTINTTCGVTAAGATCNNTLMGQATNTLSAGLSSGQGTLSPLYQQGGPRSLQFLLKLQF